LFFLGSLDIIVEGRSVVGVIDRLGGVLDVAVVDLLNFSVREVIEVHELANQRLNFVFSKTNLSEKVELVLEDSSEVARGVSSVSRREHNKLGIEDFSGLKSDLDGSGDTFRVLRVVFFTTVLENHEVHEFLGDRVVDSFLSIVLRKEDELLPDLVKRVKSRERVNEALVFDGLTEHGRNNVDHGVISRLSGLAFALGGVTNDTESRFVSDDLNLANAIEIVVLDELVLEDELLETFKSTSRLMLIETKLEVHAHQSEVITTVGHVDIEGRVTLGRLVESEDSFRVTEDILRSNESVHGSLNAHKSGFSGETSRGSLGVRELLSGSDGSEWNVVSAEHTNSVFHLERGSSQESTISSNGSDGSVNDVIDLVGLQGE
jgi:hypothetical protein